MLPIKRLPTNKIIDKEVGDYYSLLQPSTSPYFSFVRYVLRRTPHDRRTYEHLMERMIPKNITRSLFFDRAAISLRGDESRQEKENHSFINRSTTVSHFRTKVSFIPCFRLIIPIWKMIWHTVFWYGGHVAPTRSTSPLKTVLCLYSSPLI